MFPLEFTSIGWKAVVGKCITIPRHRAPNHPHASYDFNDAPPERIEFRVSSPLVFTRARLRTDSANDFCIDLHKEGEGARSEPMTQFPADSPLDSSGFELFISTSGYNRFSVLRQTDTHPLGSFPSHRVPPYPPRSLALLAESNRK